MGIGITGEEERFIRSSPLFQLPEYLLVSHQAAELPDIDRETLPTKIEDPAGEKNQQNGRCRQHETHAHTRSHQPLPATERRHDENDGAQHEARTSPVPADTFPETDETEKDEGHGGGDRKADPSGLLLPQKTKQSNEHGKGEEWRRQQQVRGNELAKMLQTETGNPVAAFELETDVVPVVPVCPDPYGCRQQEGKQGRQPGGRRPEMGADFFLKQGGNQGGNHQDDRELRKKSQSHGQAETPPRRFLALRQRDSRPCRRKIGGGHTDVGRLVHGTEKKQGHAVEQQVAGHRLPLSPTETAEETEEEHSEKKGGHDGGSLDGKSAIPKQHAEETDGPDHQQGLVEGTPVPVAGTIPVVGLITGNRQKCPEHGMKEQCPDQQGPEEPPCPIREGMCLDHQPSIFLRRLSSRSVSPTVPA